MARETGLIYHITTRSAWESAKHEGGYTPSSFASEGFIHCSFAAQVPRTARKYYQGQSGLVLLHIDPNKLTAELRIEQSGNTAEAFPHLYGPLNLDAVVQATDFDPDNAGGFATA